MMNENTWKSDFLKCLELGTTKGSLAAHFNEIVVWMRGACADDADYCALESKHSTKWLALRYEEFLDRLLVSENAASKMFPANLSSEEAKARYRQLIRVFHPDRGAHEDAWLNYRAERVNKVYKKFQQQPILTMAEIAVPDERTPKVRLKANSKSKLNTKIKYNPNFLRNKLGNARQVQQKIILGLLSCSVVIILIVLASSQDVVRNDRQIDEKSKVDMSSENLASGSIALDPEAQKILDQAQWLNESQREDSDLGVGVDLISENNDGAIDFNFSSFDIQRKPMSDSDASSALVDQADVSSITRQVGGDVDARTKVLANGVGSSSSVLKAKSESAKTNCDELVRYAVPVAGKDSFALVVALNVRSGPSKNCSIITSLSKTQQVTKTKRVSTGNSVWALINWQKPNGRQGSGWASERFLSLISNKSSNRKSEMLAKEDIGQKTPDQVGANSKPFMNLDKEVNVPEAPKARKTSLESQLKAVIQELDSAFERGDSKGLAALYVADGRENNIKGAVRIHSLYAGLFKKTGKREIVYNIGSYRFDDFGSAQVTGTMVSSSSRKSSGRVTRTAATFILVMVKVGENYKIESFDWKAI